MRTHRLVILLLVVAGCKATVQTSSVGGYSEDLSVHRPKLNQDQIPDTLETDVEQEAFVPLTGHIKNELDSIARISLEQNKSGRYVDGFVIQVYSGTSRSDANASQVKMNTLFPDLSPRITYRQPSFRVKGGKFIDRLEANRVFNEVKVEFPRALLIPERLLIRYE